MQLELEKAPHGIAARRCFWREAKRHGLLRRASRPESGASTAKAARKKLGTFRKKHGLKPVYKARRHVRSGVRKLHSVHVLDLRRRGRVRADLEEESCDSKAPAPTASGRELNSIIAVATASYALREDGYETVMINCNPETVSTDL